MKKRNCFKTIHTKSKSEVDSALKTCMPREKGDLFFRKKRHDVWRWCKWQDGGEDGGETYPTLYAKPVMAVAVRRMMHVLDLQHERKCRCWT